MNLNGCFTWMLVGKENKKQDSDLDSLKYNHWRWGSRLLIHGNFPKKFICTLTFEENCYLASKEYCSRHKEGQIHFLEYSNISDYRNHCGSLHWNWWWSQHTWPAIHSAGPDVPYHLNSGPQRGIQCSQIHYHLVSYKKILTIKMLSSHCSFYQNDPSLMFS